MPHVHKLIDFAVSGFIVYEGKVLLIKHKQLKKWLPVGGHIELDENPEDAIIREVKEESGLTVTVRGEKPLIKSPGTRFLHRPRFLDIADLPEGHKHIHFIYFLKAKNDKVKLAEREHNSIRWFTSKELEKKEYDLQQSTKFYCEQAIKELNYSIA
ncbi:NUDIX domain-containing protein [Patescibacteria group bacterium]|nr:NUDIX domain-containing protein [Patescibacteria group bacterium]